MFDQYGAGRETANTFDLTLQGGCALVLNSFPIAYENPPL